MQFLTIENLVVLLGFGLIGLMLLAGISWNRKRITQRILRERQEQRVEENRHPPLSREQLLARMDPRTRRTAEEMESLVEQRRFAEADAKVNEMIASWEREIEQKRNEILRSSAIGLGSGRTWLLCVLMLFIFAGWWMQVRGSHDFIFGYDLSAPAGLLIAGATFIGITLASGRALRRARTENRLGVKLWFSIAFGALMGTWMLMASILGWMSIFTSTTGSPVRLEGKVLSLGAEPLFRDCGLSATIRTPQSSGAVCIGSNLSGAPPKVGGTVMLVGRQSMLGLVIERIDSR